MDLNAGQGSDNEISMSASDTEDAVSVSVPVDDEGFETLAAEIREVLTELAQDKAMDAFRGEYEKLFNALEKSHRNEKRLNTKCHELGSEIASKQAQVDAATDKTLEDQDTISSLKKEIEKAWKMVDMTQEREERARETIETLNTEIQNLTKVIEEKTLGAEDTNLNELRKLRDELTNQRDNLKSEVNELKNQKELTSQTINELKEENAKLEMKNATITQDMQSRTNEMNREIRRKERAEREVKQLKGDIEDKNKEIEKLNSDKVGIQASVGKLEQALNEQRTINDGLVKQLDSLNVCVGDLQKQIEAQTVSMQQLEQEVTHKTGEIHAKEEEVTKSKLEMARASRELEDLKKKMVILEKAKEDLTADRAKLKAEVAELKHMFGEQKHAALVERKKLDATKQEVVALEHNLKRSAVAAQKTQREALNASDEVILLRNANKTLEVKVEKQRKSLSHIEEERDHYLAEANEQAKRVEMLLDEVRDAESVVFTYRKDLKEMGMRLKQQHNLYQAVRNDRNALSKKLNESQDETADLKGKLKMLNHQFDQLKEEIEIKEAALVKEGQEQAKLQKEKEDLSGEVDRCKVECATMSKEKAETEKSHLRLKEKLQQVEKELTKTEGLLEAALRERSAVDGKLGKVTSELEVANKKIGIQERVLARGESKYQEREEDIRVLKLEVKRLRHEETLLIKSTQTMEEMKKEVLQLQKDLLQEKAKVKSLKTELENPLNVHRWRKLEGNDPPTLELIHKIQSLQRRLIARKEDLVDRELSLQEKDKLLSELRQNLARQPGADIIDEARSLKVEVKKKSDTINGLVAEKNMYQSEVILLEEKLSALADECHAVKRKFLDLTKKHTKLKESLKKEMQNLPKASGGVIEPTSSVGLAQEIAIIASITPPNKPKFVGGGFSINIPSVS